MSQGDSIRRGVEGLASALTRVARAAAESGEGTTVRRVSKTGGSHVVVSTNVGEPGSVNVVSSRQRRRTRPDGSTVVETESSKYTSKGD